MKQRNWVGTCYPCSACHNLMKEKGVKKQTAYSWLQIGNKTHCFVGGDPSHPNINDIHVALRRITLHMKVKGNYEEIFF